MLLWRHDDVCACGCNGGCAAVEGSCRQNAVVDVVGVHVGPGGLHQSLRQWAHGATCHHTRPQSVVSQLLDWLDDCM